MRLQKRNNGGTQQFSDNNVSKEHHHYHNGQSSLENIMDVVVSIQGGEVNLKSNAGGKHYNDGSRGASVKRNNTTD